MTRALALCLLAASFGAVAAPPDARLSLLSEKAHFEKIGDEFVAVLVDAPDLLHAELLPTLELLLEPKSAGVARVFLFTAHVVRVIEVAIEVPLPEAATDPTPPLCLGPGGAARIGSPACYQHWRTRLQHLLAADAPSFAFEDAGLFAEVKAAQAALDQAGLKVKIAVSPFGVRLTGAADDAEQRRALLLAWPFLLGTLRLDR